MASAQEPLPPVTVADDGSAGGTVEVPLGRELEVALRANPTTGYTWRVSVDAAGPLRLKSKAFRRNPDAPAGNVGVGGIERFLFETTGTGSARLQFDYRRSAPGQSGKTYELMVTVVP